MTGAVAVGVGSGSDGEASADAGSTATAAIERRDLVEVQTEDGTLGYADNRTAVNRMAATVMWLPRAGSVVRTKRRLYAVDGKAAYLLDGASPAYRDLAPGISGRDVAALERNLRALGKDPSRAIDVDGTRDAGTTAAGKRWQHDKELAATGTIELGRVVSPRRPPGVVARAEGRRERRLIDANPQAIYLRADPERLAAVRDILASAANPEHPEEVQVSRPPDALQAHAAAKGAFTSLLLGLGAVALLVGGVGIANVMVISVLERRSEIGLRRALGATRRHIGVQFLTESLLLGAAGGTAQRCWEPP